MLLKTIDEFISQNLDEVNWRGVFLVDGLILKLFHRRTPDKELPGIIKLNQLDSWQEKARYAKRRSNQKYISLLKMTKEKCFRNDRPPTRQACDQCMASKITEKQIYKRKEVCLPRIMGLPIEEEFDGFHHGHEIADVKYEDSFNGIAIKLGVHLKSRTASRVRGLGRSVYAIKSLYTQAFYLAYQVLKGDVDFDVIGISIPNAISKDVLDSIQLVMNNLGFSLLVVDESDWLKIFDAALEAVAFEEAA
ncbi:MAG: hypothetical protein DPW18_05910 [Chloroflexi bacterium]|nr:hypothetical protein [Chloroflexota bacterium]MDL1942238.1 hypothetical protein [Chloroflexi bacterium CFX2]